MGSRSKEADGLEFPKTRELFTFVGNKESTKQYENLPPYKWLVWVEKDLSPWPSPRTPPEPTSDCPLLFIPHPM